jgi:hypothetical protein
MQQSIFLNRNFNGTMSKIRLKDIDTRASKQLDKEKTKKDTEEILEELDELQNLLYAESKTFSPDHHPGDGCRGKGWTNQKCIWEVKPAGGRSEVI